MIRHPSSPWGSVVLLLIILARAVFLTATSAAEEVTAGSSGLSKINIEDLRKHVVTLAGDALEGREAGSRGGKATVAYLRTALKTIRARTAVPPERVQEFGGDYQNLLVLLPGSDEKLKHQVVVVGAHHDHVGYGKASNSQGPLGYVHNGADDNASGTAAVLELIEAFSSLEPRPACSILFAFWDAEEVGLLGSKHWVANPTIPLQQLRFVLNLDMLGRLRNGKVITVGWRSAAGLRPFLAAHNTNNFLLLAYQPKVIADSDHHPFYSAGIPAIHLDTDKHDDYHRPTDDPDRINWDGLQVMTEYAYRLIFDAANRPEFPRFRRDALTEPPPDWMVQRELTPPPVRLGVTWDERRIKQNLMTIAQVNAGSPAANAGLLPGDRLVQFGVWQQNNSFDTLKSTILAAKNPVAIRIERPGVGSPLELTANLAGSPIRLGAGWRDDPALPDSVVIAQVIADSPAARAGISVGDVILSFGGRPLNSSEEMKQRVTTEPGPFQFRIERDGRIQDLSVDVTDERQPPAAAVANP
ncbi:M20/M25/M40 family metallo-hydrolase [Schlesneria sp. T3-172]|uniref:M20/M25/M40 family metallo-hydrolase n=1 Tax=Schlesneria sphaerica TaxID=3373610 RepID=UPI0037C5AAC2